MEILESLRPKHIVQEFTTEEGTHVVISDDFCVSREQVPEILRRIARDVQRAFAAQQMAEQIKENEVAAS